MLYNTDSLQYWKHAQTNLFYECCREKQTTQFVFNYQCKGRFSALRKTDMASARQFGVKMKGCIRIPIE